MEPVENGANGVMGLERMGLELFQRSRVNMVL